MIEQAKHPADMTAEEFFALPEAPPYSLQPLRRRHDPIGFADEDGAWWVYCYADDGTWARMRLAGLR